MSVAVNEADRLAEASGDRYNRVVRLAQAIFGAPIAALNLIGETHQHTVAAVGAPTTSSPLTDSICRHTVEHDDVFEVFDLREDQRFQDNKIVAGPPRVRFYVGVPLQSTSGHKVGALCILDLVPRELGSTQREMLADLGAMLERELAVEEEMIRAGEVQRLLLPDRAPALPGIDVAGRVRQARDGRGDFFDWHLVATPASPDQLQLVIADVMGKGLSASLIASEMRAVLRTHSRYVALGEAIQRTADTTVHDLENSGSFVTMWAGRLDPEDGTLHYVDAGHGLGVL